MFSILFSTSNNISILLFVLLCYIISFLLQSHYYYCYYTAARPWLMTVIKPAHYSFKSWLLLSEVTMRFSHLMTPIPALPDKVIKGSMVCSRSEVGSERSSPVPVPPALGLSSPLPSQDAPLPAPRSSHRPWACFPLPSGSCWICGLDFSLCWSPHPPPHYALSKISGAQDFISLGCMTTSK